MNLLTLSNDDVQFVEKKLTWRTYTIEEGLPIICQVKIIN